MWKAELILETDPIHAAGMPQVIPSGSAPSAAPGLNAKTCPDSVSVSRQFWSLDHRNIRAERIAGLIFSSVLMTGVFVALVVLWWNLGFGLIWSGIAAGAIFLVVTSFLFSYFWPPVEHRHASWRLDEEGLEIRLGVFWRHQLTIPLGRVQHADVSQGPLQRPFGIGTLTVHTAGTQNASVELKGLSHSIAIELRDLIVRQRKDQHVV